MRQPLALLGVVCLLVAAVAPAAAVHDTGGRLVVALEADGDATVTRVTHYDLTNESERRAFERLESNETARQKRAERFRAYLQRGAERGGESTGREMAVSEVSVNLTRGDENGTVRLRATWSNLASTDDRRVAVSEPFAGGFPVNRTLAVRGPDGYARAGTNPPPGRALRNVAYWGADEDLSGFRAIFADRDAATPTSRTPTATATPAAAPVTAEGLSALFGAAALALLPAALLVVAFGREGR